VTALDTATLEGFAALLAVDGRAFTSGAVSKTGLVEEQEANPTRFDSTIEEADEVILHFRRSDVVASGWTVAEGLILTGADGLTYRVTKVFPDHSVPIQRLRCRVTDLS
jgi:hypothetical protein